MREDVVCRLPTVRSDPTSPKRFPHNPTPPAGGAAFQNNSFSFIILSLRADAITARARADVVFDTQSFFLGGPDVLACQSARPTSMIARPTRGVTLPGPPVVHCYWCSSARPSSSSATCHSFPGPSQPPNHPTAGSTLSALSPRDTELAGRPDDGWSWRPPAFIAQWWSGPARSNPCLSPVLSLFTLTPPRPVDLDLLSFLPLISLYLDLLLCSREVSRHPRGIEWSSPSWVPNMWHKMHKMFCWQCLLSVFVFFVCVCMGLLVWKLASVSVCICVCVRVSTSTCWVGNSHSSVFVFECCIWLGPLICLCPCLCQCVSHQCVFVFSSEFVCLHCPAWLRPLICQGRISDNRD